MRVFIFGAGYSARAFAAEIANSAEFIGGTTRSKEKFGELEALGIVPFQFGQVASESISTALANTTHVLVSIAPPRVADGKDPVLETFEKTLREKAPNIKWIGYLSTVGVYGNHDGAWVDEETECKPVSERSIARVAAENDWLNLGEALNIPVSVLRLSGIYGPGRNAFMNIKKGTSRRLVKPGQVFNRIHVGDIASFVTAACKMNAAGIFNITDNEPAPPQDVVTYAHELMGIKPPAEIDFTTAELSPMARSFYGENKRVSNGKSRSAFGRGYEYADYRIALKRMWESGSWKA